jgi:hypothetical protein
MQGGGRFLRDQTDTPAANFSQVLWTTLKQIPSLEEDGAFLNFSVGWKKLQESSGKRTFARAGFSEYAKDFSCGETKIKACKSRADFARASEIRDAEIFYFKKRRHAMDQGRDISRHYPWSVKEVRRTRRTNFPAQEGY